MTADQSRQLHQAIAIGSPIENRHISVNLADPFVQAEPMLGGDSNDPLCLLLAQVRLYVPHGNHYLLSSAGSRVRMIKGIGASKRSTAHFRRLVGKAQLP